MNCDEVRDLTGAYALGSVTPEEKRLIEAHLADCDLHDEIVGLTAGRVTTRNVPEGEAGLIIDQRPAPGTLSPKGGRVNLVFARRGQP